MLRALANLFRAKPAPLSAPRIEHPDVGMIEFDSTASEWNSADDGDIAYLGIPGTAAGPAESAIAELLARQRGVDRYWDACEADLRSIAERHDSIPKGLPVRELDRVAAFAWGAEEWEVCFQTLDHHKWIYVAMQFRGEELVSNSITT